MSTYIECAVMVLITLASLVLYRLFELLGLYIQKVRLDITNS